MEWLLIKLRIAAWRSLFRLMSIPVDGPHERRARELEAGKD
jgi:hypothetical protein